MRHECKYHHHAVDLLLRMVCHADRMEGEKVHVAGTEEHQGGMPRRRQEVDIRNRPICRYALRRDGAWSPSATSSFLAQGPVSRAKDASGLL